MTIAREKSFEAIQIGAWYVKDYRRIRLVLDSVGWHRWLRFHLDEFILTAESKHLDLADECCRR
jgi:hypothetical protein